MELRRLRYFLRIAAEGSLGKASRALGIAQPALGRQIQLLESELGVRLFERVPRGMVLTDEGQYLRDALDQPLERIDIALHNVRSYAARVEAALTLGLPPILARTLGPALVRRLRSEMPNLRLRVVEGESSRLSAEVSHSLVDIALVVDAIPDSRAFHAQILTEPLMLVGAPAGLPATPAPISFAKLAGLPLILPGSQSGRRIKLNKAAAAAEFALDVVLEIDSLDLAIQAALAGTGFAILAPLEYLREAQAGTLAGVAIAGLEQSLLWTVQPHWRVPRSTYNEVERIAYEEMRAAVTEGRWPADWKLDLARLSLPLRERGEAQAVACRLV